MTLPTLATPDLDLPPLGPAHAAMYVALYTDPRVMARIGPPLDDDAAARAFRRAVDANARPDAGQLTWAVVERASGRTVGIGALLRREADTEMGLMLRPVAWNARWSQEVIDALVAHAFDDLHIDRLTGICQAGPAERMSRRLLASHGFIDAPPDRAGTARWILDRTARARPVGSGAATG